MEKAYYVFDRNNRHVEFDTYTDLLGFLSICDNYRDCYHDPDEVFVAKYSKYFYYIDKKQYWDYDVYNAEFNRLITKKLRRDIRNYGYLRNKQEYRHRGDTWWWRYYGINYLGFRNGPIPKTGKPRYMQCDNSPRTMQCIRDAALYPEYTRGRRKHLPTIWETGGRSDYRMKSWKKRKVKSQWM